MDGVRLEDYIVFLFDFHTRIWTEKRGKLAKIPRVEPIFWASYHDQLYNGIVTSALHLRFFLKKLTHFVTN